MIAAFLSIITSRLAGPIAIAGAVVLSIMLVGAKLETAKVRGDLKAQVAESKKQADGWAKCRSFTVTLDAKLTEQNAAVAALEAQGSRLSENAEKAASDLRSARAVAESRARELAGIKSAATCEAREKAVVDLVGGLTR